MVVALLPICNTGSWLRETTGKKTSQVENTIIADRVLSTFMHIATAPLRLNRVTLAGDREYTAEELPFEPRGGVVREQLLPGGEGMHAPVQFVVTAHLGDGMEICSHLHSQSNNCAACGCPPHLLGCPQVDAYKAPLTNDELFSICAKGEALFNDFWQGNGTQSSIVAFKSLHGRIPGIPYANDLPLPMAQTFSITDKLHGKDLGPGRTAAEMTKEGLGENSGFAALADNLAAFAPPTGGRNLPRATPLKPRTGEEGRTFHELLLLAILCEFDLGSDGRLCPTMDVVQITLMNFWLLYVEWIRSASRETWVVPLDIKDHFELGMRVKAALWELRSLLKSWGDTDDADLNNPSDPHRTRATVLAAEAAAAAQDAEDSDYLERRGWLPATNAAVKEFANGSSSGFKQ